MSGTNYEKGEKFSVRHSAGDAGLAQFLQRWQTLEWDIVAAMRSLEVRDFIYPQYPPDLVDANAVSRGTQDKVNAEGIKRGPEVRVLRFEIGHQGGMSHATSTTATCPRAGREIRRILSGDGASEEGEIRAAVRWMGYL
jgi:hypothetical protein